MKILVAPLNWGLGHASRCVPLVRKLLAEGNEVMLGGDGDSLRLLQQHFPELHTLPLAELNLRYSRGKSQVLAMARGLFQVAHSAVIDHFLLQHYQKLEHFDMVISDNRFGLYTDHTKCVYITHQLHIRLPKGWRWLEPLATRIHAHAYNKYKEIWVPDYADQEHNLSGWLSHGTKNTSVHYIGPLSRFEKPETEQRGENGNSGETIETGDNCQTTSWNFDVVAVLSGLEPQRSILEQEIRQRYANSTEQVLLVQGLVKQPKTRIKHGNITTIPHLNDAELQETLLHAKHIIARSGYSTIMDLHQLGLLDRAELIPTPGQSEQEYLAEWIKLALASTRA